MRALLVRNSIYIVIIAVCILFMLWEMVRFWLRRSISRDNTCPKCHGEKFYRVHRRYYERVFGVGMNLRRYHCADPDCNWEGLRKYHKRTKSSES